jgi:hypothetical protein
MAIAVWTSFEQLTTDGLAVLNGGSVTVYLANTTTLVSLYTADDLTGAAANPITLDSAGRHPMRYMAAAKYKILIKDSLGNTIDTYDNIDPMVPLGSGVLAIVNGGTGASTGPAAIANLGGATATEVADLAADVAALTGALVSTDAGAAADPIIDAFRDSPSPAPSDNIGQIQFNGRDSVGNKQLYASITGSITTATSGAEDGRLIIQTVSAGAATTKVNIGAVGVAISALDVTANLTAATASGGFIATQAEQETGTAVDKLVTPGRQQFHQSAAKMWGYVTVSGGTPTLQSPSYNITSITDTAAGRLTVTIATDFSSANWALCPGPGITGESVGVTINWDSGAFAAGSFEIRSRRSSDGALTDPGAWSFAGFGDL